MGPASASKRHRRRCSPDRVPTNPASRSQDPAARHWIWTLATASGLRRRIWLPAATSTWIRSIHHHWSSRSPLQTRRSARRRCRPPPLELGTRPLQGLRRQSARPLLAAAGARREREREEVRRSDSVSEEGGAPRGGRRSPKEEGRRSCPSRRREVATRGAAWGRAESVLEA
jgi:hypothetical protein